MSFKERLAAVALAAAFVIPAAGPAGAADNPDPVAQEAISILNSRSYENAEITGNAIGCSNKSDMSARSFTAQKDGKNYRGIVCNSAAQGPQIVSSPAP